MAEHSLIDKVEVSFTGLQQAIQQFSLAEEARFNRFDTQLDSILAKVEILLQRHNLSLSSFHGAANSCKEIPASESLNVVVPVPESLNVVVPAPDEFIPSSKQIKVPSVSKNSLMADSVTLTSDVLGETLVLQEAATKSMIATTKPFGSTTFADGNNCHSDRSRKSEAVSELHLSRKPQIRTILLPQGDLDQLSGASHSSILRFQRPSNRMPLVFELGNFRSIAVNLPRLFTRFSTVVPPPPPKPLDWTFCEVANPPPPTKPPDRSLQKTAVTELARCLPPPKPPDTSHRAGVSDLLSRGFPHIFDAHAMLLFQSIFILDPSVFKDNGHVGFDLCSKISHVGTARQVFDEMPNMILDCWNSMFCGYITASISEEKYLLLYDALSLCYAHYMPPLTMCHFVVLVTSFITICFGLLLFLPVTNSLQVKGELVEFPLLPNFCNETGGKIHVTLPFYDCDDSSLCKVDCETIELPGCKGRDGGSLGCCYPFFDPDHSIWHNGEGFSVVSQLRCRGFSSWAVLQRSYSGKRGVKLEGAIPRNLSKELCARKADMVNATSIEGGVTCVCQDGYVGEGFANETGCLHSSIMAGQRANPEMFEMSKRQGQHGWKIGDVPLPETKVLRFVHYFENALVCYTSLDSLIEKNYAELGWNAKGALNIYFCKRCDAGCRCYCLQSIANFKTSKFMQGSLQVSHSLPQWKGLDKTETAKEFGAGELRVTWFSELVVFITPISISVVAIILVLTTPTDSFLNCFSSSSAIVKGTIKFTSFQYDTLKEWMNFVFIEEKLEVAKGTWNSITTSKGCELNVSAWAMWILALFSKGHVKELRMYILGSNLWKKLETVTVRIKAQSDWGVAFNSLENALLVIGATSTSYSALAFMTIHNCYSNPDMENLQGRQTVCSNNKLNPCIHNSHFNLEDKVDFYGDGNVMNLVEIKGIIAQQIKWLPGGKPGQQMKVIEFVITAIHVDTWTRTRGAYKRRILWMKKLRCILKLLYRRMQ